MLYEVITLIGAKLEAIRKAENRELFQQTIREIAAIVSMTS